MAKMREASLKKRQEKAIEKKKNPPKPKKKIDDEVDDLKNEIQELKKLLDNNKPVINDSKITNTDNVADVCIKKVSPNIQTNTNIDLDLFFKDEKPVINDIKTSYEKPKPEQPIKQEIKHVIKEPIKAPEPQQLSVSDINKMFLKKKLGF